MVYLDNAATTFPKPESVYCAMDKANRELAVNAGRGSYKLAREASGVIAETKSLLRKLVKAENNVGVVFTPSITIALNEIIGGMDWNQNDVVYASTYEHNAVARTLHHVSELYGVKIKLIPLKDKSLEVDIEKFKYELSKEKPKAVFCTHVSNVTGYILPVSEIFTEAKKYGACTVLDSAQSLGLVDIDVRTMPVDIIAFAGHKTLYGPFGIGGFVNVSSVKLNTYIVGGTGSDSLNLDMPSGIEVRYESSSTNIVSVHGLNAALKEIDAIEAFNREKELTDYLVKALEPIEGITVYLPAQREKHIAIVSFVVEGYLSEEIGEILDADFDIAVRTGYHCAPWIHDYIKDKESLGTVRVGVGRYTEKSSIDELIAALIDILNS